VASRDKTPEGQSRFRSIGPVFERQEAADEKTFTAFRPFYSRTFDPGNERTLQEYLWPVAMSKDFRGETYWRVLCAFGHDFDNDDPESRYRFIIFPIFYMGRDIHDENYFAVFPIGGKVNEFLGRDKIWFALFPLYMYSSINDVKTYDVLWPIVSWTGGSDISRFRVFPFYGQSSKGDLWTKRFVLWPIWTSAHYSYADGQTGGGFVLFPLFGHTKLTDQESWMFLPPFFRWSWNDEGYRGGNSPWPFIQYSFGKGRDEKLYLWPLWGTRRNENLRSSFFLWPIGSTLEANRVEYTLNRFSLFPLLFYEKKTPKSGDRDRASSANSPVLLERERVGATEDEDGTVQVSNLKSQIFDPGVSSNSPAFGEGIEVNPATSGRYFKLWPLVSYQREDEAMRVRLLDLWPGKRLSVIERNYSPFWTLYSHVRADGASEDELLWGLFRRSNSDQGKKHLSLFPLFSCDRSMADDSRQWSFLMGLTGYKREGLRKTYRLLYFFKFSTNQEE
jgi:hypothetical protein